MALVVDVQRAPATRDRAIVDDRAQIRGNARADESRKCRRALSIEIGFETVSHGFVKEDAGPAVAKDDFHRAGRRLDGLDLPDGLTRRVGRIRLGRIAADEMVEPAPPASAGTSDLTIPVVVRDAVNAESHHRLDVAGQDALARRDHHDLEDVGDARLHFADAAVVDAGRCIGVLQHFDLHGYVDISGREFDRIEIAWRTGNRYRDGLGRPAGSGDRRGGARRALDRPHVDAVGVGETRPFGDYDTDADPLTDRARRRLDDLLLELDASRRRVLEVEVRKVASASQRYPEQAVDVGGRDPEAFPIELDGVSGHCYVAFRSPTCIAAMPPLRFRKRIPTKPASSIIPDSAF